MAEYVIHDKDKAAFINRLNKLLKQMEPGFELDSTNFVDIPGSSTSEDMSIFVTEDPVEEKMVDMLVKKRVFSYPVKKISLRQMAKESLRK